MRTLKPCEIKKRLAIARAVEATPGYTKRELASTFSTSYRVVYDALGKGVETWERLLDRTSFTAKVTSTDDGERSKRIEMRPYQEAAVASSLNHNTLLVLPTGLGKTVVALYHAKEMLSRVTDGISVMMAPTRALLVQHRELFKESLGLAGVLLAIVDGGMRPPERKKFYAHLEGERAVLFMTPQTVQNDLEKGIFPRDLVIDVIVDEAHHATEGHPYNVVYTDLRKRGYRPRLLALTASPGETGDRIAGICRNLGIKTKHALFKSKDDDDVKPYTHELEVTRVRVNLTMEYVAVRKRFHDALEGIGRGLARSRVLEDELLRETDGTGTVDAKEELVRLMYEHLRGGPGNGTVVATIAACIKVRHAINLLCTQGLGSLLSYHASALRALEDEPKRSSMMVLEHPAYLDAMARAMALARGNPRVALHPKLQLLPVLLQQFLSKHPDSRAIVFTWYRASVLEILPVLRGVDGLRAERFVGQGHNSKRDRGMSRRKQQAVLREFKRGACNVLVATQAAEEGLDVAECDLVVFYEATPSVIQSIQRQGRTARRRKGHVKVLMTAGTSDEVRAAILDMKLQQLEDVYYQVQTMDAGGETTREAEVKPAEKLPCGNGTSRERMPQGKEVIPSQGGKTPVSISARSSWAAFLQAGFEQEGICFEVNGCDPDILLPNGQGIDRKSVV